MPAFAIAEGRALETATATNWILENYTAGSVVIWQSGAICTGTDQNLHLNGASTSTINRLYATIVLAKIANARIFIRYTDSTCTIDSFGYL